MIIRFQPMGKVQEAYYGDNLMECIGKASIPLNAVCAGEGTCGKCRVKILTGDGGPLDPAEKKHLTEFEIRNNWRLACKVRIIEDITIEIP
ncbi:MAG: 2Fe-2S iron-sulfur cluster-binding protein, partial [Eubacteriales bacterium]|nr:2Fe-2S iron-sulfur cluster-binding protein [Eubacteriales bacterium]MDD4583596.1 2Fe-2S iron-sulfur cluster-binding protein [Eubacteriales bacterium]